MRRMDGSYNNPSGGLNVGGGGISSVPGGGIVGAPRTSGAGMPVGGAVGGVNGDGTPGGIYSVGTNGSMISSGGMGQNTVMPGGVISSGTGDIVLNNGGGGGRQRNWKKIGLIGGAVAVVVLVVVLVVAGLTGGGGRRTVASNVREAFNLYANYFLTGEVSIEDIDVGDDEDFDASIDEDDEAWMDGGEGESIGGAEIVEEYVKYGENGEEIVMNENGEVIEILSDDALNVDDEIESDIYFYTDVVNVWGDATNEYLANLDGYFVDFWDMYREKSGDEGMPLEVEKYADYLDLIVAYYSGADLSEEEMIETYNAGGAEAVKELINEVAAVYEDMPETEYGAFGSLMTDYGEKELELIERYAEYGCLAEGEVDYGCVEASPLKETSDLVKVISVYRGEIESLMDSCADELGIGLYTIRDLIYGEDEQNEE